MPGLDVTTQESAPNLGDMTNAEIGAWINSAPNKEERNIRKASAFVRLNMGGPEKLKAAYDYPPPSQGAQLRSLFDALHQAMIKYSPPIYPVDLALVTLKEALDQIP